jgi:hypothetical protein
MGSSVSAVVTPDSPSQKMENLVGPERSGR